MNRTVCLTVLYSILALFLSACGPSLTDITVSLLEQGKNDEALARMYRALLLNPEEAEYHNLIGIALYNKKEYPEAISAFEKALKYDDEDDQAAYYMAASYENLKEYNRAIRYYRLYTELTFFGEFKKEVEARMKVLYRQQMQLEAQRAVQMEQQLDVAKIPANTVAILYFENKGQKAEFNPLQKGLAEMIITDLSKVRSLKVVERIRLQKLVEEMNLAETDLVDQKTAPRLGKLLGAYRLIKGSFFELKGDKMNIDAFVTQTRTGELDWTANIAGDIKEFFRLEKDLVFKIIDEMKIKLTNEEREAILEIPTENFFAFLQYSRGLDLEDQGLYSQAFEAYSQAVQADPKFTQAKSNASSAKKAEQIFGSTSTTSPTSGTSSSSTSSSQSLSPAQPSPPPASSSINRPGGGNITDRITNIIGAINTTIIPGTGSQNQPPPAVVSSLPEPPKPPGN